MIPNIKTNTDKVAKRTVLLRCDFNEPISEKGHLLDDFRIKASLPTIDFLRTQKASIIIAAHLGRPEGKPDKTFSLKPVAERLAHHLGLKFVETDLDLPDYPVAHLILFKGDITKDHVRMKLRSAHAKDIILLENIRFYKGEEENNPKFAKQLSELADVYVNDAFGTIHRKSASVTGVTKYIPSLSGLLLQKEITNLNFLMHRSNAPFIAMMAGIKISEKIKALEHVAKKADSILLGGGLANIVMLAKGMEIGKSAAEVEAVKIAFQLEKNYQHKIMLPVDVVVAHSSLERSTIRVVDVHRVGKRDVIVDIGPRTILAFAKVIKTAKTIVWNGPMGKFEHKPFDTGTMALAKVVGGVSKGRCYGVAGGGETVNALRIAGQEEFLDHVSTGGGAMLDYIAGEKLPGIQALEK